jgi:hypothetical protein
MTDEKKRAGIPMVLKLTSDRPEAADLPDEVYGQKVDDDDEKLDRAITNARLIETRVPPESEWAACWACGKKVPLRFRDPLFGILVCRACLWTSAQHEVATKLDGIIDKATAATGLLAGDDDDDEGLEIPDEDHPGDPEIPQSAGEEAEGTEPGNTK